MVKLSGELKKRFKASDTQAAAHHKGQISEFRDFAKHMVENTHKAVIEALQASAVALEVLDESASHITQTIEPLQPSLASLEAVLTGGNRITPMTGIVCQCNPGGRRTGRAVAVR